MTALIDSEYEIPAPLVLQNLTSVAQEKRSGWSSDSVNTELSRVIVAVACPRLLADSVGLANWSVLSIGYLQG